jgi:Bacterial regulatory protein, Fis family
MASRGEYSEEEKARALTALAANRGDVSRTARQLGISRRTLKRWVDAAGSAMPRASSVGQADSLPFGSDWDGDGRLTACPTDSAGRPGADAASDAHSLPRGPLADELEAVARRLAGALDGKIEEATLQQTATALGIVVTKMQLLRAGGEGGGGSAEHAPRIYIPDNGREEEDAGDTPPPGSCAP